MMQAECGRIAARHVVIAADHNSAKLPRQLNRFIGVCAVANDIAEIPDDVVMRRSRKNCLESRQIGMNVGNDKRAHLRLTLAFWPFVRL